MITPSFHLAAASVSTAGPLPPSRVSSPWIVPLFRAPGHIFSQVSRVARTSLNRHPRDGSGPFALPPLPPKPHPLSSARPGRTPRGGTQPANLPLSWSDAILLVAEQVKRDQTLVLSAVPPVAFPTPPPHSYHNTSSRSYSNENCVCLSRTCDGQRCLNHHSPSSKHLYLFIACQSTASAADTAVSTSQPTKQCMSVIVI